jgi:hypothetical protein
MTPNFRASRFYRLSARRDRATRRKRRAVLSQSSLLLLARPDRRAPVPILQGRPTKGSPLETAAGSLLKLSRESPKLRELAATNGSENTDPSGSS